MNNLGKLCQFIRYDIVTATTRAGTGHPTSSLSAVELMTVLFFGGYFHYDLENPRYIFNDRIIFSKGHASPLLYALYHVAGVLSYDELLTLRKFGSKLEGHPTPEFKYVEVATGSLGQGLSVGVGMALGIKLAAKQTQTLKREPKIFVLLGDSEMAEGQVWEALGIASHYKLNNLVGILDVNRLGQRGETMLGWDLATYKNRVESFGWDTVTTEDGNNIEQVNHDLANALCPRTRPVMIIAKTKKGAGVNFFEDKDDWHGKPLPKDKLEEALKEIGEVDKNIKGQIKRPEIVGVGRDRPSDGRVSAAPLQYEAGDSIATREAYGEALVELGKQDERIVVLDAEVSNSTYADKFKKRFPERFFEMYIAEQNMISIALGLSKVGFTPYASSFAAFLTRAFDQIRMAQYSEGAIKIVGSHAGVSIGYDGSSQMGLEDLSMFRSLLNSTVFYPADATSTHALVTQAGETQGIVYIRITREKTPVLYKTTEIFKQGGSKTLRQSDKDVAVIFAAGITLHEALKAHGELQKQNIYIAVVDLYSVKPLDHKTIEQLSMKTKNVIVVEDHYPAGGLGEAVSSVLSVNRQPSTVNFIHLCVHKLPHSGSPEELLDYEEINAAAIVRTVKKLTPISRLS